MNENFLIKYLKCPCCDANMALTDDAKSLACEGARRHTFDFSSKGHINFALTQSGSGDSKEAVRSRSDFLNKGYYEPIREKLCEILSRYINGGFVIDAGCGEGYYTEGISEKGYLTAGFDLSKFGVMSTASRMRCKHDGRRFAAVASVFEIPVKCETADVIVSIFAPCAEEEFSRVLKDKGILIVVSAGEEHLMGLKRAMYREVYGNDERADMPKGMVRLCQERLKYTVDIEENEDILNLFSMTPYYWRTSRADAEKLSLLESLSTEIDILFTVYTKESETHK